MSFQDEANRKEQNDTSKSNEPKNGGDQSEFIDEVSPNENDLPVPPSSDAEKIASLETELASVNAKLVETHDKMLRIAADADNTRKRLEKEKLDARLYSIQEFARNLLPVIDSFEKVLQTLEAPQGEGNADQNGHMSSVMEGVKLVSKIFQDAMKKHGIERLPGKDAPFNPSYHNAIAKEVDGAYKTEIVIEEFMPGYKIGDRVLRTGLVKVGAPD